MAGSAVSLPSPSNPAAVSRHLPCSVRGDAGEGLAPVHPPGAQGRGRGET